MATRGTQSRAVGEPPLCQSWPAPSFPKYDKENIRMKKYAAFAASVAISGAMLVGCGGNDDFCDAAPEGLESPDISDQGSMQDLADELNAVAGDAPDEIKGDVETVADAFQQIADGNTANLDQAAVQEAANNITEWDSENC
jgi:hypothetical protein